MYRLVACCLLLFMQPSFQTSAPAGTVELNDLSFDKITQKFDFSLIKFDVAFPYGEKHDAYVDIARDAMDIDELLVAEVGVKDYGEKDNEALATKYGATKENFPVVKLIIKGKSEPISFDENNDFTTDELRKFVREHTGLYLTLPGCIQDLDRLTRKFMKGDEAERIEILKTVKVIRDFSDIQTGPSVRIYKTIMDKIMEKGDDFAKTELERVKKILGGKISEDKKKQLNIRLNILHVFQKKTLDATIRDDL